MQQLAEGKAALEKERARYEDTIAKPYSVTTTLVNSKKSLDFSCLTENKAILNSQMTQLGSSSCRNLKTSSPGFTYLSQNNLSKLKGTKHGQ